LDLHRRPECHVATCVRFEGCRQNYGLSCERR
jgi:hypothetical protein